MTITAEELEQIYDKAYREAASSTSVGANWHRVACAALGRYVAEKQRAVEPTQEMREALAKVVYRYGRMDECIRAMQSVAPLVVPE